jgi:hypothetical protein
LSTDAFATHTVVDRSPFRVDDHEFTCSGSTLLGFGDSLLSELFYGLNSVNVGAVGSGSEDGTDQGRAVFVRTRKEGSDGLEGEEYLKSASCHRAPEVRSTYVVDEGAAPDLDVLGVESILQELDDILTDGVLAVEPLGPGKKLSLVKCGLLDGETVRDCASVRTRGS